VGSKVTKLNKAPLVQATDFADNSRFNASSKYWVVPVVNKKAQEQSEVVSVTAKPKGEPAYRRVPLRDSVMPGRVGVADLNGDGELDFIILQPAWGKDPSFKPDSTTLTYKIEAYLSDGTFLWRNDLGDGIEPGVWYSPFIAYDFDGDGKAEVAVKTAPAGVREVNGRVITGEEWISIWDGMTGKELSRANWPPRTQRLGDYNRQSRNQLNVAYLDGKTPCLIVARGTYRCMMVDAYQFTGGKLQRLWSWDGDEENPVVRSQGAHAMLTCDVDDDGRDEILLGSAVLDDSGTLLWSAGLGHPDKIYVTDIDPSRPGLEVFYACEVRHDDGLGVSIRDAKTGEKIWGINQPTTHVGDGMVADIDPSRLGLECWASEASKAGSTDRYLLDAKGNLFAKNDDVPPCRTWVWWDADKVREMVSGGRRNDDAGISIAKYKGETLQSGIRGRIALLGDIAGDWREEVVTALPGELRIYHTTIPAKDRRVTLLQDNTYRQSITTNTMGYQQSPVPSYYLGE
jgi:hypothetical protein